jgi:hypothetical protein
VDLAAGERLEGARRAGDRAAEPALREDLEADRGEDAPFVPWNGSPVVGASAERIDVPPCELTDT